MSPYGAESIALKCFWQIEMFQHKFPPFWISCTVLCSAFLVLLLGQNYFETCHLYEIIYEKATINVTDNEKGSGIVCYT